MRQAAMLVLLILFALCRPDVVVAQSTPASQPTPAEIERPQPSARATTNPHAPHHHFDTRHPHRSTRPKVQNPATAPD